jgi:nucleotide-binding universal stress UspA family protein
MFRRIVVPLDGSPLAQAILPHVQRLAAESSVEVVLLAVGALPPPAGLADRQPDFGAEGYDGLRVAGLRYAETEPGLVPSMTRHIAPVAYLDQLLADEKRELQRYLGELAARLAASGVPARTAVRFGEPAAEIVACAEAEEADAIAMSTHGRTGLDRLIHGSVAGTVLRRSHLPVLLYRPTAEAFDGRYVEAAAPALAAR